MLMIQNKKGSVFLSFLIILTGLLTLALTLYKQSETDYYESNSVIIDSKLAVSVYSALKKVEDILKNDNASYDSYDDDWSEAIIIQKDDYEYSIEVTPLNSKININLISDANQRYKNACELLVFYFEDSSICQKIDDISQEYKNSVSDDYFSKLSSFQTIRFALKQTDSKTYGELIKYFTVFGSKLNINFASKATIDALLPELENNSSQIVETIKESPLEDIDQLKRYTDLTDEQFEKIKDYVTVSTEQFYVKITITTPEKTYFFHTVIERVNKETKIIMYIEGQDVQYF